MDLESFLRKYYNLSDARRVSHVLDKINDSELVEEKDQSLGNILTSIKKKIFFAKKNRYIVGNKINHERFNRTFMYYVRVKLASIKSLGKHSAGFLCFAVSVALFLSFFLVSGLLYSFKLNLNEFMFSLLLAITGLCVVSALSVAVTSAAQLIRDKRQISYLDPFIKSGIIQICPTELDGGLL